MSLNSLPAELVVAVLVDVGPRRIPRVPGLAEIQREALNLGFVVLSFLTIQSASLGVSLGPASTLSQLAT